MDPNYLISNPDALSQVFKSLQANDTTTVKQNEKLLNSFIKSSPQALIATIFQLKSNDPAIRHQVALYLKKKMNNNFLKLNDQQQQDIKNQLLNFLTTEQDRGVCIALSGLVASISKIAFNKPGGWPEVFTLLNSLAQQQDERLREVSFNLLDQLFEHIPSHLRPHANVIVQMFLSGLQDSSVKVKSTTITAISSFISAMDDSDEIMLLQQILTPLLTLLRNSLADEDLISEGLDVFQECCGTERPLINDHIEYIIPFSVQIMQNENFESTLRYNAAQTLMTFIECRPKLMSKKQMVLPALTSFMQIVAQGNSKAAGGLFSLPNHEDKVAAGDDDEEDEDYDDDAEETIEKVALACIDSMALHISPKYFVNNALTLCIQGLQSPDPKMRKSGAVTLGVIAEGSCNFMKPSLSQILQFLLPAVTDSDVSVRESACFTLGQFSEFCQPEILHYHSQIFPVIFAALDDSQATVQGTTCYILEYFCENLQRETLRPFLHPLMTKLAVLLQNGSKTTKGLALTATAATALATEIEFLPYAEAICGILGQYLFSTDESQFTLRGRSLECLGHIAIAIGEENFARYFEHGMQSANTAIAIGDDDLKEHSYVFYANCAKVMKNHFTPYLSQLVPHLLQVVGESEIDDDAEDEDDQDDDDEDEEGDKMVSLNVHEGFINNKKAAITALGALAEHLKEVFAPWIQEVVLKLMQPVSGCIYSHHGTIKGEAVVILQNLIQCGAAATGIKDQPPKGFAIQLPENLSGLNNMAVSRCIHIMKTEEDMEVVANASESIQGMLRTLGLAALTGPYEDEASNRTIVAMEALATTIIIYLQEKAPCQLAYIEDDEEDEEDGSSTLVTDSISDLIGTLAKTMGAQFVPYFDAFVTHLLKYTKPDRPYTDKAMAIGCMGEVIGEIGPESIKYKDVLIPLLASGVADQTESVRRNSAFTIGALIRSSEGAMVPHFMQILQLLHPLCARRTTGTDTGGADVDNTLSTVAHMIRVSPDSVPLNQVLPVMLEALPLRADHLEGENVYGCLIDLLKNNNAIAITLLANIKQKLQEALQQSGTLPETTKLINEFLAVCP